MLRDNEQLIRAWRDMAYHDSLRLSIVRYKHDSDTAEVATLKFVPMPRHCAIPSDSIMTMTQECAQGLMDDLWKCGIRPTEGAGTAGSMAAAQKHLADMRAIVSKKLNIVLP